MSSERVLSLRNRASRVALSLLPEADLSTTPMDPARVLPVNVPIEDPDNVQSRLAAMERMLQDLSLRLTDSPSQTPVGPSPGPASTHGILVRNRRYDTVLSVDTYRLRDQTSALRPDQMTSLSSTAALIRPRLEGSFFSGSPSLDILPFLAQVVRVANQTHISEATLCSKVNPCLERVSCLCHLVATSHWDHVDGTGYSP
jgi:hypothetical protein